MTPSTPMTSSPPIPRYRVSTGRRFPPAMQPADIRYKQCLWCGPGPRAGDLVWDVRYEEWACANCGWREYELTRKERHGNTRIHS